MPATYLLDIIIPDQEEIVRGEYKPLVKSRQDSGSRESVLEVYLT
jgi:hypothetical protein